MNLEVFTFCDAANDSQGKLNILGAFDTVNVPAVPAILAQCAIAVRMRYDRIESGEHLVTLRIILPSSTALPDTPSGKATIPPPPPGADIASGLIVYNITGLPLPEAGKYRVAFIVDDVAVGAIPLYVVEKKE